MGTGGRPNPIWRRSQGEEPSARASLALLGIVLVVILGLVVWAWLS